ncbi:uncharacterized protein LOC127842449 [Dreissena polymorpha]|uniref:uncharacterized protein LOC127842449 n=1 Tax=Dreissena polymorpha TaxID=45954 RepID=UPI00226498C9|nr:uncharacterized protein LOC127842449 [Dreissena polymorpha]
MQSLQDSYYNQLHEIHDTRNKMNTILYKIKKNTMKELDDKLTSLKTSVMTDADNCSKLKNELKRLSSSTHNIVDKGKAELTFIASNKCLVNIKLSDTYLKKNSVQVESSLTFLADSDVQQNLSKLSGLGRIVLSINKLSMLEDPDTVFTVQGISEYYDVSIQSDSKSCYINAICVLSDNKILIADVSNKRLKLLNHQYQVVDHCDLSAAPRDICQITPREVAVIVDQDDTHEVQYGSVHVNGGRLIKTRNLRLEHGCNGIAYNLQDLYLTFGTVLCKNSMSDGLLKTVYEGTGWYTVFKCAVSPSGDKIFVTNLPDHEGHTLATDGTVLHSFTDPTLKEPCGIHVTALGQVLVCGYGSDTILQLDSEGKKKLATLAITSDGVNNPMSVCYNKSTASLIVGQSSGNNILVLRVK